MYADMINFKPSKLYQYKDFSHKHQQDFISTEIKGVSEMKYMQSDLIVFDEVVLKSKFFRQANFCNLV